MLPTGQAQHSGYVPVLGRLRGAVVCKARAAWVLGCCDRRMNEVRRAAWAQLVAIPLDVRVRRITPFTQWVAPN